MENANGGVDDALRRAFNILVEMKLLPSHAFEKFVLFIRSFKEFIHPVRPDDHQDQAHRKHLCERCSSYLGVGSRMIECGHSICGFCIKFTVNTGYPASAFASCRDCEDFLKGLERRSGL
jgi:hypothetical protein